MCMKCIFCKTDVNIKDVRYSGTTPNMDGICEFCLKGLKKRLGEVKVDN